MEQELSETGRRRIQTVFPEYLLSLGSLGPSFMLHVITTQLCRSAFMHFVLAWGLKPCNNLTSGGHRTNRLTGLRIPGAGVVAVVT